MLNGRKILVGVTGGIAAYKTCELVRLLIKNRADVSVVMTSAATQFVAPLTFEAITGKKVALNLFAGEDRELGHLDLVRDIDLMVIAPATANCVGKLAGGLADDLLSTIALALSSPLLICPAMNPKMYGHPAVTANLETLKGRGVHIMDPDEGEMASPREEPGRGRLPEPGRILDQICRILPSHGPLSGTTITVTAGPTQEPLDPVRVIGNLSSGRMGYAIAAEARKRGAEVRLVSGPVSRHTPPGLTITKVHTTEEMRQAVAENLKESRILIMAAAPCDFQPREPRPQKIKKEEVSDSMKIDLAMTPDILKEVSSGKGDRIMIGFALETEDGIENARAKLRRKNLDLVVLNAPDAGSEAGLGKASIVGTFVWPDREEVLPQMPKAEFAAALLDRIQQLLSSTST
jgi:phosphopantothenoylcysteine decarboxylase/phosphopantothenate--cysteine ligase